ncbi:MAG: Txe/YoeB family addiction module toxin [Melioribacteraceae bacterium]|nr:Txe/YoeB family addiction module toxin [Melioribacteraceae bacterium]MCF8263205.1 Txe/YoeB family addiction module toxin [Melioribacteraceae bacterium]MCF8412716.1 Txe/YoeB family addiction module toxin [Melioribacteraceae bacterium]MCF8431277.1 Txe/YoeB family addiction module toxin [Melioribacteraceae bacterium]
MRSIVFEGNTWKAYEKMRDQDKKLHLNLCKIIQELQRGDPTKGLGKPEALKNNLSSFWSRRISLKDRVVYKFDKNSIYIFAIGGHYDQL